MFLQSRLCLLHFRQFCSAVKNLKEPVVSKQLNFNEIKHKTKVPLTPYVSAAPSEPTEKFKIHKDTLKHLETLALVNLSDKQALKTLEESIEFASKILHIDTTNVTPLYSVHENHYLDVRGDEVSEGNIAETLLSNSPLVEEEFFVSAPGNIPVELEDKNF